MLVLVAVSSCGKKELTCEQAVAHMNTLMVAEIPEANRAKAQADLAAGVTTTIAECKARNTTQVTLRCLLDAKATADFNKCK